MKIILIIYRNRLKSMLLVARMLQIEAEVVSNSRNQLPLSIDLANVVLRLS